MRSGVIMPATLLRNFWYVIARSTDLRTAPLARKVCGRELVAFRDGAGQARVLDAVCPHRGANLAHGRVVDGCLACPYHGWRFDGEGRCTRIPAYRPRERVPAKFSTGALPVIEQQGLVWTSVGTPVAAPPRFSILDETDVDTFCYELAAPLAFDWWVENALDFAHLPFVHPNTLGDDNSMIDEFDIETRPDDLGFVARAHRRPDYSMLARMLRLDMRISVELAMPGNTLFDIDLGGGRRQVILALATPEDGSAVRTWNFSIRNFLRVPFGNAIGWLFLRRVLQEDVREGVRSLAPVSLERPRMLSTRADALGLELLRLLRLWRARETADGTRREAAPNATDESTRTP